MTFSIRTAAIAAMLAAAPTLAAANTFVVPLGEDVATDGVTDDTACETTPVGETCEATIDGRSETLLVVDDNSIRTAVAGGVEVDGVTYAPGLPNGLYTGNVTNMYGLFAFRYDFNADIGHWDTSQVTTMSRMFGSSHGRPPMRFNQDISNWDTSSVTDMTNMFYKNTAFNQDIGSWDVSNVENMGGMFSSYYYSDPMAFNQDISNWDTSSVINMSSMFYKSTAFNQDIGGWDVSNVKNMNRMFYVAREFNQDIGAWDVSNVTNMKYMFFAADNFNQDIGGWDVSNVDNMSSMFWGADLFNQDIAEWDVSSVENMARMFRGADDFDQDLSGWDVSNVTNMRDLFRDVSYTGDISEWCVPNLTERPIRFGVSSERAPNWGTCPQ